MKRLSRCLFAFGVLAVISCARREAPQPAPATLSLHLAGDPSTLDPTTISEEEELRVVSMMFRPLVGLDRELRIVPALAKSWTILEDGLVYEFHLDPSASWDDGTPVTSDDVRFTIERVHDPRVNASGWSGNFEDLVSVETPDAATVRVRFRKPYSERMLGFDMPIVSAKAFARAKSRTDTDRSPVGSGPYRFDSWEIKRRVRLLRRPDAPAATVPFSEVVFRVIPDETTRFRAGERGELDEFKISRDQRKTAEAAPEFLARNRILRVPQPTEVLVVWNMKNPFLSDLRVRRALAAAWNRQEAARQLYPPDGATLVSGPYPAGVRANADVPPPSYDPALAGRLLDEAGWKAGPGGARSRGGQKAALELLVRAQSRMEMNLAEILRNAYQAVGVELKLQAFDAAVYGQRAAAGDFESCLAGRYFLPPNLDPYPYYHSSQWAPHGLNTGFYKEAEADRVMEEARREVDPDKRLELYRRIHRLLAADPPADFAWGADQFWGVSRRVEGVEVSPIGLFHFLPGPLGWRPATADARTAP